MKNLFIKTSYILSEETFKFLSDKNINFIIHERIRSVEIISNLSREQKIELLKEIESRHMSLFSGRPQSNLVNQIVCIL